MEPFSITCTTCQAKLKVRSAAAIGQILACPKCESMVQVLPPPGWEALAAESTAAVHPAAQSPHAEAANHADPPPLPNDPVPVGALPPAPASPPVELPPLTAAWAASPAEAMGRKVARNILLGGLALVLTGVAIGFLLTSRSATPEGSQAAVDEPPSDLPPGAPFADPAEQQPTANPAEPNEIAEPDSASVAAETEANTDRDASTNTVDVAPSEVETPPAEHDATTTAKAPQPTEPMRTGATAPTVVAPVEPAAPASSTSAHTTGASKTPARTEQEKSSFSEPAAPAQSLAAGDLLSADPLDRLLPAEAPSPDEALVTPAQEMTEEELRAAAEAATQPAAEGDVAAELPASSGDVRRVPAATIPSFTANDVLALPLAKINVQQRPLDETIHEFSRITALPITLDLAALAAAGVPPGTPVSVDASEKTLGEVLTALLATKKLAYRTAGRQVVVTSAAALAAPRSVKFSVDDLASNADAREELAALLIKFVDPASWQYAGGAGVVKASDEGLTVQQTAVPLYEAIVFCEKLRVARSLPTRSRLPATRFRLEPALSRAATVLSRPVACTYSTPAPLTEILHYLEEVSGAAIYVDWSSIPAEQLSPQDGVYCTLSEQALAAALQALLVPLGLEWRVLDERTIEVFAASAMPAKMTTEFYPLRNLLSAGVKTDVLLQGVRQMTGEQAWSDESGGFLWLDARSQHLVVRQGRRVHGQVQHLLEELARKLAAAK